MSKEIATPSISIHRNSAQAGIEQVLFQVQEEDDCSSAVLSQEAFHRFSDLISDDQISGCELSVAAIAYDEWSEEDQQWVPGTKSTILEAVGQAIVETSCGWFRAFHVNPGTLVVVLPGVTVSDAEILGQSFLNAVNDPSFPFHNSELTTISVGVAGSDPAPRFGLLVKFATDNLELAQDFGGNKVVSLAGYIPVPSMDTSVEEIGKALHCWASKKHIFGPFDSTANEVDM